MFEAPVKASPGLNLALDFLPGSVAFDAIDAKSVDPLLASSILWFDAYVSNVDRTPRNTNMLWWHRRLMLIDHGASLYFHRTGNDYTKYSRMPFTPIKDHILLRFASQLAEADALLKDRLTPAIITDIINMIPATWLEGDTLYPDEAEHRAAYVAYLLDRLQASHIFVEEALNARAHLV